MKKKFLCSALFCILIFSLFSCKKNGTIVLDDSESLGLSPGIEWAMIQEPYAAFRKEPNFESPVSAHARRGEIMQVLGNRYVDTGSGKNAHIVVWYLFEQGWLDESLVKVYDNKLKAMSVAKQYSD